MRYFTLLDRITNIEDNRLTAERNLTLAEDYLADHFPTHPVMPGVFLLEAMVQSAGWLMRVKTDFSPPLALLTEARNVRYIRFLEPGEKMVIEVELSKQEDNAFSFRGRDLVDGEVIASARFTLCAKSSGDVHPSGDEALDQKIIEKTKARFALLRGQEILQKTSSTS